MHRLDLRALRRFHVYADVVLVSLGWLGAFGLRYALNDALGRPINAFEVYVDALPLVVPAWIGSCWAFGIYRAPRMRTLVHELRDLLRGVVLGLLVISSMGFLLKELDFGRFVVLASAGLNLILQGGSRAVFHRLGRDLQRSGRCDVRTVILGTGATGLRLLQKVQDHPEIGYRVVGFLDESASRVGSRIERLPVLGKLEDLHKVVREHAVEEVFVALPSLEHERMLSLVLDCEQLGVTFRVVTDLFEVLTAGTEIELVDTLPLVRLGRQGVHALYEPAMRAVDVAVSLAALLLGLPIWLAVAVAIRLDGPGPALFTQDRVGRDGRIFRMVKFRTMRADARPYERAPCDASDARITRLGHFLRRTSIDEVPQFWNVLRGDMALVGPRPEMPFIVEGYDAWQRRRLSVKPGITGLWQILGRKDLPMHQNLQYDFYYIRNRSLLFDLSILLRTAGAVLTGRGAF